MLPAVQEQNSGPLTVVKERWEDASPTQKLGLAAAICLVLAVLVTYNLAAGQDDWKPLFSNLSAERASQVVEKLDEMGQPYRLGGEGNIILVPPTAVNRWRLELASAGLLEGNKEGFELFESASLGRSDFSERVTYLRALQGELTSTISTIPNIRKARVHLNINKKPIFLDQQPEASAAVFVEMSPGSKLNDNQIRGIISLVANSVEGLDAERVTLFDATGTLQISGKDLEQGGVGGEGDAEDQSNRLSELAQSMVDRILGPGKGLASVRVELDYDTRRVERESHDPGADGKGVPIRREDSTESFEGTKPNVGNAPENAPPVTAPAEDGKEKPKYSQSSTKVDYAVSKTKEILEEKPGGVARISASVIVDSGAGLTQEQLDDLAQGVKVALGLRDDRGDMFELKALPFNREHIEAVNQEIAQAEQATKEHEKFMLYVLAGAGGTTLIGIILGLLLKRRKSREEVWMDVAVGQLEGGEDQAALEEQLNLLLPAEEPEEVEESTDELLVRALEEVERDPESVARLLERWVAGEGN